MKKLKTILQFKSITIVLLILSIIYSVVINYIGLKTKITEFNNPIGKVLSIQKKDSYQQIIIKSKEKIVVNYSGNINIRLGDTIKVFGKLEKPKSNTIENTFNYKKYLYNKGIFFIINSEEIKILKQNTSLKYKIKEKIIKRCNEYKNKEYLLAFIIGEKNELEYYNLYKENGINHIFALSGMHIAYITIILSFVLKKIKYKDYLIIIILSYYILLTDMTPSIIKSLIFYIILKFNKKHNFELKTINVLLLTISILLFINPLYINDIGFQYSIATTIGLIISQKYYKKNYLYNIIITSCIANLFSIPITLNNYYQYNLLSIINNIINIPIISLIIYPLSWIIFIFKFLEPIYVCLIYILQKINIILNLYSLNIIFNRIPMYLYIIYYALLLHYIYSNKNKYLFFLILFLLNIKISIYMNKNLYINYLDVNQGDSTIIIYNNKSILIDTGGYKYKNIFLNIKSFIFSKGISKINYLIITHGDYDHMGEAINLVNNIKIENVIFNCSSYNELEQELIKVLEKKDIKYYSCIKEINIDKYKMQFLNTKEYDNENDNSNVIYFKYHNYKFLFMGDAGVEKEKDILIKYNLKNIDFLKVGHHGSNSSSSNYFINRINPKYSLISVGKNNRYGHPKDEVLDTLRNSKIYRTDLDGSIEIKLNKNGYKIRTCPPQEGELK